MNNSGTNSAGLGSMPGDIDYYTPFAGFSRKQLSKDCVTCSGTQKGLVHDQRVQPAITNPESGGYVPFDVLTTGASGTKDYDRAMKEAQLARTNPTLLAQSTSKDLDVSWHEPIVPRKPKPVQLAGMSVFGTGGPTSTTRGMTTDFRGEAVEAYAVGPPPEGASISGRMGTVQNVKEALNRQTIPPEMRRCYANPDCRKGVNVHQRNLSTKQVNNFMRGFTVL